MHDTTARKSFYGALVCASTAYILRTSARAEQSQQARAAPTLVVPVCFAFLAAPRTSILGLYLPHEITNLADLSAGEICIMAHCLA